MCLHERKTEFNSLSAGFQGPLKGPGSSRVVLMLSRAIWALFLSILMKNLIKKQSWSNFRGGGPVAPPYIRHWLWCQTIHLICFFRLLWGYQNIAGVIYQQQPVVCSYCRQVLCNNCFQKKAQRNIVGIGIWCDHDDHFMKSGGLGWGRELGLGVKRVPWTRSLETSRLKLNRTCGAWFMCIPLWTSYLV